MTRIKSVLLALAVATASTATLTSFSQAAQAEASAASYKLEGTFVRKSKKLKGGWDIVERDGKTFIVFGEDFRAAGGPDLKVFLSPQTVSEVTGKTATRDAVNLGDLSKTKGVQEYQIPEGLDLSAYGSVLVHCEAYSVLWGGSDL